MLTSSILSGNSRLDEVSSGAPSIKKRPPDDDNDAVQRIQRALVEVGYSLPKSFPNGPEGDPDGKFGDETYGQVQAFQKRAFPSDPQQWDGRVGQLTLAALDALLPEAKPLGLILPAAQLSVSRCCMETPAPAPDSGRFDVIV